VKLLRHNGTDGQDPSLQVVAALTFGGVLLILLLTAFVTVNQRPMIHIFTRHAEPGVSAQQAPLLVKLCLTRVYFLFPSGTAPVRYEDIADIFDWIP
jgi:hypothetical protein